MRFKVQPIYGGKSQVGFDGTDQSTRTVGRY